MGRAEPALKVEVVYSPGAREVQVHALSLPAGSTVADALRACGWVDGRLPEGLVPGVWGRRQPFTAPLRDGDRVEVYRALTVDPKQARRLRYKRQPKKERPARAGRSEV